MISRLSITLAVAVGTPSPLTRYGKPHSRVNAPETNIVQKCVQNASRVPGTDHASRTCRKTAPPPRGRAPPNGASRTTVPVTAA